MIYLKWLLATLLDVLLLPTAYLLAPVIAAFTRPQLDIPDKCNYSWGGIYGTYDNPPQGDQGFIRERCFFPQIVTGWRGYLNRCLWMWRNPLYSYQKIVGVKNQPGALVGHIGDASISDKYARPGWYYAELRDCTIELIAFELYCVLPWGFGKCLRVRIGYKIMTDKLERFGFAPLVDTINPVKSYGKSLR